MALAVPPLRRHGTDALGAASGGVPMLRGGVVKEAGWAVGPWLLCPGRRRRWERVSLRGAALASLTVSTSRPWRPVVLGERLEAVSSLEEGQAAADARLLELGVALLDRQPLHPWERQGPHWRRRGSLRWPWAPAGTEWALLLGEERVGVRSLDGTSVAVAMLPSPLGSPEEQRAYADRVARAHGWGAS